MIVEWFEIAKIFLTLIVLPLIIWIIKLNTKVLILETKELDRIQVVEIIFKKLEQNREDLHEVNLKAEKILTNLEHILEK